MSDGSHILAGLIDAHCHLHFAELDSVRSYILDTLGSHNWHCVINGTQPEDWSALEALARANPQCHPAYGWHPWHTNADLPAYWRDSLEARLEADPQAGVGEIGLDKWLAGHDIAAQLQALESQLEIAVEYERPVSLHCLRALGLLKDTLNGFRGSGLRCLLHAYSGPIELLDDFLELGCYLSFNRYFMHERKAQQRDVFCEVPIDRLLVETDAPAMAPPPSHNDHPLSVGEAEVNDPRNLSGTYHDLAQLREMPVRALQVQVASNFSRWWEAAA